MDKSRFCRLWQRNLRPGVVADEQLAGAVFEELAAHYGEPHRHYHTGGHIDDCLSRMDLAAEQLGHSDSVELAIWFHDVIYESGAADNERRSADWFIEKAADRFPPEMIRRVEGYIMSTTHREPPTDHGAQFVVDVDLSGIGMPAQSFWRDGDNIRKEFVAGLGISEAEFLRGQSRFLENLLARERIYSTPFFHDLCEARARRNIGEVLTLYAEQAAAADQDGGAAS